MVGTSFSLGRFMGVELRVHLAFPLLLALAVGYSIMSTGSAFRGFGLWLALLFALAVREIARAIAAAYAGLRLRALFLLPMGGVMALTPGGKAESASTSAVTWAGPLANFGVGLLLSALSYAIDPHVGLAAQPWITPAHILRSVVALQFLLGAVNVFPAAVMPTRSLLRGRAKAPTANSTADAANSTADAAKTSSTVGMGTIIALSLILIGLLGMGYWPLNLWPLLLGGFMLLGGRFKSGQALEGSAGEALLVREVMLTEYTLLSSSDTLEGALARTVHSLQDVFPVVRGDRLVGSVSRQTITAKLQSEGDRYLQGVMTRNLQLAGPSEKLIAALRRAGAQGASEFIPVVEGGAMLGILTPQSLSRAVQQIKTARPPREERERS
jgi:predicted transcriptional regulator